MQHGHGHTQLCCLAMMKSVKTTCVVCCSYVEARSRLSPSRTRVDPRLSRPRSHDNNNTDTERRPSSQPSAAAPEAARGEPESPRPAEGEQEAGGGAPGHRGCRGGGEREDKTETKHAHAHAHSHTHTLTRAESTLMINNNHPTST